MGPEKSPTTEGGAQAQTLSDGRQKPGDMSVSRGFLPESLCTSSLGQLALGRGAAGEPSGGTESTMGAAVLLGSRSSASGFRMRRINFKLIEWNM